jgi:catechol 2,3-dioxygenase-like lactoylglutathione lyase family enzyme
MLRNMAVAAILPVTDLDKAKSFYVNTLGLEISPSPSPDSTLMFKAGNDTVLVTYKRAPVMVEHTQAGFMVEDIYTEMADLKKMGVKFEDYDMPGMKTVDGVAEMGGVKSAWFKDPFGNIIALNQMS